MDRALIYFLNVLSFSPVLSANLAWLVNSEVHVMIFRHQNSKLLSVKNKKSFHSLGMTFQMLAQD